jgi:hypothetical protein
MKKALFTLLLGWTAVLTCGAEIVITLTSGNRLVFHDSATPATSTRSLLLGNMITESLVAIDFRPATGDLHLLGASGKLYVFNLTTSNFSVPNNSSPVPLSGTRFGFDFNPVVDRIRLTSDTEQNLRLDPSTGAISGTDNPLSYAAGDAKASANPNIVGSAYTNNFVGAGATTLYDIDSTQDTLVYQNPPNGGVLHTVGPLGVDTSDVVGFDISQVTGVAYAALTVGGTTGLYTIDLASGAATFVGNLATVGFPAESIIDLAVPVATRLLNVSTRGLVGIGDEVLIGGFINRGGGRLVLRAIGPSLAAFDVPNPLPDPVLTLKNANGQTLASNDNWQTGNVFEINAVGFAPSNEKESVILTSLAAGNYTAIVSSKTGESGVALVEVYQLAQ